MVVPKFLFSSITAKSPYLVVDGMVPFVVVPILLVD